MRVTLEEGNTPLVASVRIGPQYGAQGLLFKLESCNPSGSYKDRFIAAALDHMLRGDARACVATSPGNTGSALAAYCARYQVRWVTIGMPEDAGKPAHPRHRLRQGRLRSLRSTVDCWARMLIAGRLFS